MNTLLENIYFAFQVAGNKLRSQEEGATAVEYGIMVAGIAIVVIGAVALIGSNLNLQFAKISTAIKPAT